MNKYIPVVIFLFGIIIGILLHGLFYLDSLLTIFCILILFIVLGVIGIYTFNIKKNLDKAYEDIKLKSSLDETTQVYHRKFFFELFEKELDSAVRYKRKISCMLIDLDAFKKINDTYGSQVGDKILRSVAGIVKNSFRKSDIVARYDNDQFICVLPETETEPALIVAKRLVALLNGEIYRTGDTNEKIKITASIGVTAWQPSDEKIFDAVSMINMAEKALKLAKQDGGNRVDCYII